MAYNGLQLQEVGDFGDENCLPPQNLIRSSKLHLTTEPQIYVGAVSGSTFFLHFAFSRCMGP